MEAIIQRSGNYKTAKISLNKHYVKKRYFVDGIDLETLSKEIGIGRKTLRIQFKRMGLKTRTTGEARKISVKTKRGSSHPWYKSGTRMKVGYLQISCKGHPEADREGYVFAHRLIAATKIGRILTSKEDVHHLNENQLDNSWNNISIMSRSEHMRLHLTKRRREKI